MRTPAGRAASRPARRRLTPGVGTADELHPGSVGVEVLEREPFESGVLQPFDVVFDVSVVSHVRIQVDGVAVGVGVVTPESVARRREQRSLRALVEVGAFMADWECRYRKLIRVGPRSRFQRR